MTNPPTRAEPEFLSLISHENREELLKSITTHWEQNKGFTVATLNLDHIVKMRQDPEFLKAYLAHSHVVADGNPIVWLSRLAGRRIDLVPGSDLIAPLSKLAAEHGVPVALFGATEKTLSLAAERLMRDNAGLQIVSEIAPPFGFDPEAAEADAYLETIRSSGAKLCFLALGAPKQEMFAKRGAKLAPGCGFVSIGAGLDFVSGSQSRAPIWVRKLALEWVWRMLNNPRRLAARYGRCILIMPRLILQALRSKYAH